MDVNFASICEKAFSNSCPESKRILEILTTAERCEDGCIQFNADHRDFLQSHGIIVHSRGSRHPRNTQAYISAEDTKRLEKIKNEVRLAVHRTLEVEETSEFEGFVTRFRREDGGMEPETKEHAQAIITKTKAYMKKHGKNQVVHPIIEGLRHILSAQLDANYCMQWRLEDSALTERGDSMFVEETVQLFAESEIFCSKLCVQDSEDPRYRLWTLNPRLSDLRIKTLLASLPQTEFRPTGSVVDSQIKRTNRNGDLDYKSWYQQRCPWLF